MKRFLVVLMVVALMLTLTVSAFAGIELGGNFRMWYKADSTGYNSFDYDRTALTLKDALSDNNGFKAELRFRKGGTDVNYGQSSNFTNIQVDNAYYYQKNLFAKGDELNAGFVYLPFNYGGSMALNFANGTDTLGSAQLKQTTGLKYDYKSGMFEVVVGAGNLNNNDTTLENKNVAGNCGFDESIRFIVTPVKNLNVAVAYANDVFAVNPTTVSCGDLAFDISYTDPKYGGFVEYISKTPSVGAAQSGIYVEGYYTLAKDLNIYAGGTMGAKDNKLTGYKGDAINDWYLLGVKYVVSPKATLQAEYYIKDPSGANTTGLATRLKVDF